MRSLSIKKAVPMHSFGNYAAHTDLMAAPCSLPYRDKVLLMTEPGQTVEL